MDKRAFLAMMLAAPIAAVGQSVFDIGTSYDDRDYSVPFEDDGFPSRGEGPEVDVFIDFTDGQWHRSRTSFEKARRLIEDVTYGRENEIRVLTVETVPERYGRRISHDHPPSRTAALDRAIREAACC